MNLLALISLLISTSIAAEHVALEFDASSYKAQETSERLVIQFKKDKARPKVEFKTEGGILSIVVKGVSLKVSSFTKSVQHYRTTSSINDSVADSRTFGPAVEVLDPDLSNQFTLKIPLKLPDTEIKVSWLNHPARLVVDAFPAKDEPTENAPPPPSSK